MENFNYIVISNGRAGSQLCCFLLNEYVKSKISNNLNFFINFQQKNIIENYENNTIYHCHNEQNLLQVPRDFIIIYVTRNIFDLVISNQVASYLNQFAYFENTKNWIENPKSFEIPYSTFANDYMANLRFNRRIEKLLGNLPNTVVNIDYDHIKTNNDKFYDIIGVDFKLSKPLEFIKTPYDYNKLVTNYESLKEIKFRI